MPVEWELADIRARVRKLSGLKSEHQISMTDLDAQINEYYCNTLPKELNINAFDGSIEHALTIGLSTYALSVINSWVKTVKRPITVDGYDLDLLTFDPILFYSRWPTTSTYTDTRPSEALVYSDTLILMPAPDTAAILKFFTTMKKPAILSDSNVYPANREWGYLIAAGAAKILMDDSDENTEKVIRIKKEQTALFRKQDNLQDENRRSAPRF